MQERSILHQVRETIAAHGMLSPGDAVLIAVSGGADSMALLQVLLDLAAELDLRLGVVHLNHGLRGADSDSDAEFVRSFTHHLHLPFFQKKADVGAFRQAHRLSLEEAGRQVRYAFFREVADAHRYDRIATAHHADDNAELVLLNLIRGSGLPGLSGIPPVREKRYIRPLIDVSRHQIEEFLENRSIPYIIDASNQDLRHRRNRIRHQLIPLIRENFNPEVSRTLSRLTTLFREENQWLEDAAGAAFQDCLLADETNRLILSAARLKDLGRPLARRILRQGLLQVRGSLRRIRFTHIEAILDLLGERSGGPPSRRQLHLPDRTRIEKRSDRLIISQMPKTASSRAALPPPQPPRFHYAVPKPAGDEELPIPEIGRRLRFTVLPRSAMPGTFQPTTACFDLSQLTFPLIVRSPRPGDRFRPLGLGGSQKLKDFFINRKIPRNERVRSPLLLSDEIILWIAGHRRAEFARITEETQIVLKVELFLA